MKDSWGVSYTPTKVPFTGMDLSKDTTKIIPTLITWEPNHQPISKCVIYHATVIWTFHSNLSALSMFELVCMQNIRYNSSFYLKYFPNKMEPNQLSEGRWDWLELVYILCSGRERDLVFVSSRRENRLNHVILMNGCLLSTLELTFTLSFLVSVFSSTS